MWELAQLWEDRDETDRALQLLEEAKEKQPGVDRSAQFMMKLGDLLDEKDRKAEALEAYKQASDDAAPLHPEYQYVHTMLQMKFEDLGKKDLAKQEADWLERFRKAQEERGGYGGMGGMGGGTFTVK
jgi:lipopolysaccharide biosynthesis regulator YciM